MLPRTLIGKFGGVLQVDVVDDKSTISIKSSGSLVSFDPVPISNFVYPGKNGFR